MQWIEFLIGRGSFFLVIISSNYERQEAFLMRGEVLNL